MTQEKEEMVEQNESWDSERLNSEEETLYVQTGEEYDQILSRAQMSVVDDMDIRTSIRLCGPSGCGKTTLANSLAIDVQIADELVNDENLPVWNMTLDELALFHDIVSKGEEEGTEPKEYCPECGSQSHYKRKTKTPKFRCNNCDEAFEEPNIEEIDGDWLSQFQNVDDVHQELRNRGLLDSNGEKTDDYPHSRADMYRSLYTYYCESPYPSTPYFEVTMSHAKYAKDLIGHPHVNENGSTFIKGKVTKAVEASNEGPTVLNLDEINRAPTSAKDELYDALDGRVKVSMDEVGGLEIEGTPENLIIVSTMNKGSGHHVEPLDFAEKRRLRSTYYVDFLGLEYPEKEKELIVENTEVSYRLASEMVSVANEVRKTAANDDTDLSYGLPTGTLLEWANESFTNHLGGVDEPVIKGGESAVANAIYDHSESEVTKINTIISKNMQGIEFFKNQASSQNGGSSSNAGNSANLNETRYICEDEYDMGCTYSVYESEAPMEVTEFVTCPECEAPVREEEPSQ
jgi:nitric oxide reductase NorQ protein